MKVLTKEDIVAKIKAAESKYYKESPCLHCGPGNGCDDCRGCEDAKKDFELSKIRRAAYDEYEQTFGVSYQQDSDYDRIVKKEEEYNKWIDYCRKCGGNFDDDCRDCKDWDEKFKVVNSLKWLKEEFKRKYHIDYDKINKEKIKNMTKEESRDLKIDKGITIKDWIDYNVRAHGAKNFFKCVNESWDNIKDDIKQSIMDEIATNIKPETINTIEDLAKLLDGNTYRDELYNEYGMNIYDICEKNKWVIVYGASDDLIEFEGIISDEDGAWNGALCKLVKPGDFYLEDADDETYKKAKDYMFVSITEDELKVLKNNNYKDTCVVEMLWCPDGTDMSWQVNVKGAPFVKFNVMEDDEVYCEAAIIDLSNFIK